MSDDMVTARAMPAYLSLRAMATHLGIADSEYHQLRRLLVSSEELRALLGCQGEGRDMAYPPASADLFATVLRLHKTKHPVPAICAELRSVVRHGATLHDIALPGGGDNLPAVVEAQEQGGGAAVVALQAIAQHSATVRDVVQLLAERIPPAEDVLIGREEAARLLCCSPRAVGRYVRQVRRGVWRRSDVLRYIAGLGGDTR